MGPAKPAAQPVDGNRIVFPIANILAIVVSVIGATTWAVSTLSQEAQAVGGRITRVEYSVEALSREILAMTRAVDIGVSTIQLTRGSRCSARTSRPLRSRPRTRRRARGSRNSSER